MYNISNEDSEFAALVERDKIQLDTNFSEIIKKIEGTLNLFSDTINLARNHNLEKNKTFWNTARYINIVSLDLKILSKYQIFAQTEWEKRLFARQISLLIYESLDDILSLLGKEFKIISTNYSDDDRFTNQLNEIRKKLNVFKANHYEKIKAHRNSSIAHRDKDTNEQLKHIYSISWTESVNMSGDFDRIINELGRFLETIMRDGISDGPFKFNAY
jgi:hypothetical protein